MSSRVIQVGKIYKHYKGKEYRVIAIARDTENTSLMRVVYQSCYDCPTFGHNAIWAREYTMFAEDVVIDDKKQPRFEEVI